MTGQEKELIQVIAQTAGICVMGTCLIMWLGTLR